MRRRLAVPLALLLSFPFAQGAWSSGEFVTHDPLDLPAAATLRGPLLAVFAPDTAGVEVWTFTAARLEVVVREWTYDGMAAGTGGTWIARPGSVNKRFPLTNVAVTLVDGEHRGWFGFEAVGAAAFGLAATTRTDAASAIAGPFGDPSAFASREEDRYFVAQVPSHVRAGAAGDLRLEGALRGMVQGLDLQLKAQENDTTLRTGVQVTGEWPLQTRVVRQVHLAAADANVTYRSVAPLVLAAVTSTASWDGDLAFRPASGHLEGDEARFEATGQETVVDGRFDALLLPDSRGEALRLSMAGDLRSTTLARAPLAQPQAPGGTVWWVVALAAAVAGGGAWWFARRSGPRLTPDEAARMALAALEQERYQEALEWTRRALQGAPGSARLRLEEAFCLAMLGRDDEALRAYDALSAEGRAEADLQAAMLLCARDELDAAESRAVRALEREPALLLEAEGPALIPLLGRRRWQEACRRARARMEDP